MNTPHYKPFHLLIPAAGNASRMGAQDVPKQYMDINGKPVLRHTIERFMNLPHLQSVRVIINSEHFNHYRKAVHGLNLEPHIIGSNSRKSSINNGLKSFTKAQHDETILIHDAARPLIKQQDILNLLAKLEEDGVDAASLATPVSDTLYSDRQSTTVERDHLWAIQTPQAFKIADIIAAHEKFANDDSFTDDASMFRAMNKKVTLVPSSRQNIKITTHEDLETARKLMSNQTTTRTAQGFDVHAFATESTDKPLILGGIAIPHDRALTGHSDADVVLHAITDALLGSINQGDIGTHFPPSDNQWKDAASHIFLEHAAKLLRNDGGTIEFIDVTIIAEAPKIGVHREAMQQKIADILNISSKLVSIKATTTEKLGFTGRKEGIACQALATVTLPVTE